MRAIIHHRRRSSVLPRAIRGRSVAVAAVRWMMLGWLDGWVGRSSATREIDISHGQKSARNHVTKERTNESLRGGRDGRQEDTQDEWSTRRHYRLVAKIAQLSQGSIGDREAPALHFRKKLTFISDKTT